MSFTPSSFSRVLSFWLLCFDLCQTLLAWQGQAGTRPEWCATQGQAGTRPECCATRHNLVICWEAAHREEGNRGNKAHTIWGCNKRAASVWSTIYLFKDHLVFNRWYQHHTRCFYFPGHYLVPFLGRINLGAIIMFYRKSTWIWIWTYDPQVGRQKAYWILDILASFIYFISKFITLLRLYIHIFCAIN